MTQEDSFHISDPEATALEIALLGRLPHLDWWQAESRRDIELAQTALDAVGLDDIAGRPAAMLSGGERRRLAMAALLAQEVPLCLLDEPTSHLDLHQQIALLDLLIGWDGRTLVMTLHDVNLAVRYCTHVLLLFGDGAWCAGPVGDMLSAPVLTRLYRHPVQAVAGPAGMRAGPLKNSTSIPDLERSRSETKATKAPSFKRWAKVEMTLPSNGNTSMPMFCRYCRNFKKSFSGFKRSATVTSLIPFAQKYAPA
jgi:ABC-type cobalamin/Fe3+-siderophores transport system ATPase subunit